MAKEPGPLVSAVIPTYGRPDYLEEAVKSVATQTYDPIELVVIDDCSPDPVEPQLSDLGVSGLERVVVCRHEKNRGANAARNTGLKKATGAFVAFLDDDDRWRPEKVERQVAAFRNAENTVGVVYTGLEFIDGEGNTIGISNHDLSGDVTRELLCGAAIGSFTRLMIRAELLETIGGLDESLPGWQDRDLNIRLSTHCKFKPIEEPLAVHRRGSHDQIGDDYEGKRDQAYPRLVKKHRQLAAEYGPAVERRFLAAQTFALGASALLSGKNHVARQHMISAIRHDPTYWKAYSYIPLTSGERVYHRVKHIKQYADRAVETVLSADTLFGGNR